MKYQSVFIPQGLHVRLNVDFPQSTQALKLKIEQLQEALERYSCNCGNACAIELVSESARKQFRVSCGRPARAALAENGED